jgi:hypothetical protein
LPDRRPFQDHLGARRPGGEPVGPRSHRGGRRPGPATSPRSCLAVDIYLGQETEAMGLGAARLICDKGVIDAPPRSRSPPRRTQSRRIAGEGVGRVLCAIEAVGHVVGRQRFAVMAGLALLKRVDIGEAILRDLEVGRQVRGPAAPPRRSSRASGRYARRCWRCRGTKSRPARRS